MPQANLPKPALMNNGGSQSAVGATGGTGGAGGNGGLLIGNASKWYPDGSIPSPIPGKPSATANTAGSSNASAKQVPPIPVNPELISTMTSASQKKQQAVTAAEQEYEKYVDRFKRFLQSNGAQLTIISKPVVNSIPPIFEYYISAPNSSSSYVEVSNSEYDGWVHVGSSTIKTVTVYDSQTGTTTTVQVTIDHPGAKAEIFAKANVPLTPQLIETALSVALYRGNAEVMVATPPPPLPY